MRVLLVDDERLARSEFKTLVSDIGGIEIVGECENGQEAIEFVKKNKVDVAFLDMEMPGMSGLEIAEELEQEVEIVFVTAHENYAIDAFQVNASDYLLKPLNPNKLLKTIEKLQKQFEQLEEATKKTLTLEDKIFLKDGDKCWFTSLSEVRYFQSEGNYTKVFFQDQRPMVLRSLNSLEEKLDNEYFFRSSRKHIININHIKDVETWFNNGLVAIMSDDEKIEISRRQAVKFKQRFGI